ncbi:hypothetical protein L211DRAFT_853246 [Terfezia boudieri ATCC MYA-4762]|uniref:EGF-like domain-containing protein n=1 Tax=Terfezia boudieri ATCC MYA-4762 TaxID=1051890 RepID=A0A3N4LN89_9PEZI|nr:hypothetical protein L211DRAFT_853246 [Terfezia boudieri ATCC MYA-4762]
MGEYLQRQRDGERYGRFQEEEDVYALPNARRGNVCLALKERLPLPSNLNYPSNLESPTSPTNRSRGPSPFQQQQSNSSQPSLPQKSSSQPRARDPRLNRAGDYEGANTGRSLTNPPAGRARPGHPMQQARTQYQCLDRGQSRPEEHDSGIPYGNRGYLSGPQPRYNRPADYEEDIDSEILMMSPTIGVHPSMMHCPRSFLLEYDDSVPVNPPIMNPTPPAQMPQTQQRQSTNTASPSSMREVSSYYPQPVIQVSPIPEESIRHGSYASSHVIPSTWGSANYPAVSLPPSMSGEEDDEDSYRPMPTENDEQKGLVRQASLGKKSKPKITEIKSTSRQDKDSTKQPFLNTEHSPNDSSLPTRDASPPNTAPTPTKTPSPLMGFIFPVPGNYSDGNWKEAVTSSKQLGVDSDPHARTSPLYSHNMEPLNITKSMAAKMKGRKAPPPGLNLNAVRDAEARGSLTSLPDLIRRATKLAAVLETGKLRAGNSLRGSNRRTDSISDILASFPPPFPGAGRYGSRASAWPMPSDFVDGNSNGEDSSVQIASKKSQKVCGLPLWAFILLVILALLIITAAVIVPVQLVTLSHHQEDKSSTNTEILLQCKRQNPCDNGGENVATKDFCGCVCTGGFSGKTCSRLDNSCVTMDLEEIKSLGDTFVGIQNATMGSAIKRLFEISTQNYYNVQLDGSRVLSAFWASEVSCTAQNALVTFNGKTAPDNTTISTTPITIATATSSIVPTTTPAPVERRIKRLIEPTADESLIYDFSIVSTETQEAPTISISAPSTTIPAGSDATASPGNRVLALNEEVVDFSRVAILFLVQDKGLKVAVTAQENLQGAFTAGVDYGNVDVGNQVSVDLENRVLNLPGGLKVGGGKTSS